MSQTEFLALVPQFLQILLFLVMFTMGMTLTIADFKRVGQFPKAVITGVTNQIILLPIIGFSLALLLPLRPELAMGLMVVSACPGGATSNLMSHLSKGDTALSISLTAITSVITIFSIPFILNFSLGQFMGESGVALRLPILPTIFNIVKLTAVPVALGMWLNYQYPEFTKRSQKAIAIISAFIILIALALMALKLDEIGNVWEFILEAGLSVLLLNGITLLIGFISSRILQLEVDQSITISLESGMQNNVLGMAIATSPTLLNNPEMAVSAGVYGIIMCITGTILIFIFRRLRSSEKMDVRPET